MKRILFAVFLLLSCLSIHAESVYYGFAELSLDESFVYRFVKAMDAESQKAIEEILAGKKQTEDQSIIKRANDEWYVRKDYSLPEGNYYESAFYRENDGAFPINIILPTIEVIMKKNVPIDELLGVLGNRVTLLSHKENAYYLGCQVKTSEEVLELCLLIKDCAYDYGVHGVLRSEAVTYTFGLSDSYLINRLRDSYQSFVPKHEGEVLIYEMDWQGVEYSGGWVDWTSEDTETFWGAKGTDEGLAITVNTKQGQIWQPQVMVVPDAFLLEAGHDYIVRLTLKVPSDGNYQVNLGSWTANTLYQAPATASDEWQEIDVNFPQFGWGEEWMNYLNLDSRNYLESCHVLLQCGWMVGTTIVKKVQVIEKTKSDTTDVNPNDPSAQDMQLLYEKDWANVEYSEWLTAETVPDWTFEATDEGLVINNPHIQNWWWHPLVQCGEENFFSLEEGHDYFVRLTMKVPSDGIYKVVLGDWGSVDRYVGMSETPSDEWQVIDVEFSNFYASISNALVYIFIGDVVGTTILKKVQVYEKLKGGEAAIKTYFQLQNEDGIECYDFKEGDNIIFSLEIKNDTDEDAYLPPFTDILGHDVFRVYSQNGEEIGTPWDEIWSYMVGIGFIGAHSSVVFFCPWFDIPALYYQEHEHFYSSYSFRKTDEKSPLPKGDYYSKFDIKLNDKTITCNRNFKIRDNSTNIKTIKATNTDGPIYNLSGQKVDASYKGIVIQNGKKKFLK